uniref:Putative myosin tail region-interacting protein mti1 n=1 Tax=Ixodes ricinus TaxID=34613 RepID=A0A0K8RJR2_IXORI
MKAVLSLCVVISAALACPLTDKKQPCCCDLPKICPATWNVKKFESQCSTVAFQGTWNIQMATPTYIKGNNPLKTGLFCNTYPSTRNQLVFEDTTPCDNTDYNTEYVVIDQSYNLYTQCIETTKTLFSPAYGKDSQHAIFNVGTEKYYKNPITEKYPFIDDKLIRHKIDGSCHREYTISVIGADDCWGEYMVLAVINQYDNFFCDKDYIIWVMTRDVVPKWSTYQKAFEDIQKSGLNPYHLISVDHSLDSLPSLPTAPSVPSVPSLPTSPSVPSVPTSPSVPSEPSVPTVLPGDINNVVQQTSVSKSTKKSVSNDGSTLTTTMETSTVVIEISSDFTSTYEIGQ